MEVFGVLRWWRRVLIWRMAWCVKVMFIRAGIFWVAGGVGRSGEVAGDGGLGWDCSSGGVVGCGGFQSGSIIGCYL